MVRSKGIKKAQAEGKFKGRKATARAKTKQVKELINQGMTKQAIANKLNIGLASVYRILKN